MSLFHGVFCFEFKEDLQGIFSTCCSVYFCCSLSSDIWKGKYFKFWGRGKEQLPAGVPEQMFLRAWTVMIISNYMFYYSASYLCLSWSCSQCLNCEREGVNCCDDTGEEHRRRKVFKTYTIDLQWTITCDCFQDINLIGSLQV